MTIGAIKMLLIAFILLCAAGAGWSLASGKCAADMATFKQELANQAKAQSEASHAIEAKQDATTEQSTQRLDQQQAEQQKEVVYVEKQVIQYRDRWRDRTCQRPAEWVQLYNASLFGSGAAMPQASKAGSAPAGTGL